MPRGTFADTKRAIAGIITAVSLTLSGALTASGVVTGSSFVGTGSATSTFGGVVSSTNFRVDTAGGAYKSFITGSASAPVFCFDDGTDGCNDGMYQWATDGVAIATNGTQRLRVTTGGVQVVGNLSSTTDNNDDLGTPTARFNDAFFGGNVSSTGLILSTLNTGTPAASLCIDSGGNVIKVVGANCF